MKITVLSGQNLQDISVQISGTVENATLIAEYNGISQTDELTPGQKLKIPDFSKVVNRTVDFYNKKNLKPGTMSADANPLGIGFMAIEIDFIVE